MENQECCPEFHPEKWDNCNHKWENKPFIMESMPTLFHIPFPPMIGKKMKKLWELMSASNAQEPDKDKILILFRDPSAFKSDIYLSVNGEVKNAVNKKLSGEFFSKVFSGPYNDVPKFIKQMDAHLASMNKKANDYYIHYAYCPKCAKKYGNNYMIFFAKV